MQADTEGIGTFNVYVKLLIISDTVHCRRPSLASCPNPDRKVTDSHTSSRCMRPKVLPLAFRKDTTSVFDYLCLATRCRCRVKAAQRPSMIPLLSHERGSASARHMLEDEREARTMSHALRTGLCSLRRLHLHAGGSGTCAHSLRQYQASL